MNSKFLTGIGFAAMGLGCGATMLSEWVNEQKQKEEIKEEVANYINNKETNENKKEES